MPVATLQTLLQSEIDKLNIRIDQKIMSNRSYKKDAHTHKLLLRKLAKVQKQNKKHVPFSSLLTL